MNWRGVLLLVVVTLFTFGCGKAKEPRVIFIPPVARLDADKRTSKTVPVEISLDAGASSAAQGAIAKYEWDFEGDGEFDLTTTSARVTYSFANKGETVPQVRVTDSYGSSAVTGLSGAPITLAKGWTVHTVHSGVTLLSPASVAIKNTGGQRFYMIAYQNSTAKQISFRRSHPDDPLQFDVEQRVSDSNTRAKFSPSILLVNNHPAITYYEQRIISNVDGGTIRYVRSPDTTGASWPASTTQVGPRKQFPRIMGKPALAMVGTNPAITYLDEDFQNTTGSNILFNRSPDTRGDAWQTDGVTVAQYDSTGNHGGFKLLTVGGRPAITYLHCLTFVQLGDPNLHLVALQILYKRASDALGASWPQIAGNSFSEDPALVVANDGSFLTFDMSGALVDGQPAVVSGSKYVRSLSIDPNFFLTSPTSPPSTGLKTQDINLAIFKGKPVVCGYDPISKDLVVVKATDADGTAWGTIEHVSTIGDSGRFCSMTVDDSLNLIFIAFWSAKVVKKSGTTPEALKVAVWN